MSSALLITGVLLSLPILAVSLAYVSRRRINKRSPSCDTHTPPAVALRAFLGECASVLAVFLAWPVRFFPPPRLPSEGAQHQKCEQRPSPAPPAERKLDRKRIAVLLPGLGQHRGTFWLLRRRLAMAGWRSVIGATHTRLAHIDAAVRDVARQLTELQPEDTTIVLIGHGTGGLIARAYRQRHPESGIRQIITLGTPHQGTASPIVRLLPCLRELAPGSKLLAELANDERETRPKCERVAIYSDFDACVVPVDAAYDPGAFNIKVAGVGHFSMLTSRHIFKLLAENLPQALQTPAR